jgi:hypothetical protein
MGAGCQQMTAGPFSCQDRKPAAASFRQRGLAFRSVFTIRDFGVNGPDDAGND